MLRTLPGVEFEDLEEVDDGRDLRPVLAQRPAGPWLDLALTHCADLLAPAGHPWLPRPTADTLRAELVALGRLRGRSPGAWSTGQADRLVVLLGLGVAGLDPIELPARIDGAAVRSVLERRLAGWLDAVDEPRPTCRRLPLIALAARVADLGPRIGARFYRHLVLDGFGRVAAESLIPRTSVDLGNPPPGWPALASDPTDGRPGRPLAIVRSGPGRPSRIAAERLISALREVMALALADPHLAADSLSVIRAEVDPVDVSRPTDMGRFAGETVVRSDVDATYRFTRMRRALSDRTDDDCANLPGGGPGTIVLTLTGNVSVGGRMATGETAAESLRAVVPGAVPGVIPVVPGAASASSGGFNYLGAGHSVALAVRPRSLGGGPGGEPAIGDLRATFSRPPWPDPAGAADGLPAADRLPRVDSRPSPAVVALIRQRHWLRRLAEAAGTASGHPAGGSR